MQTSTFYPANTNQFAKNVGIKSFCIFAKSPDFVFLCLFLGFTTLAWRFTEVCFSFSSTHAIKEEHFAENCVDSELDKRTAQEVDVKGKTEE